MRYLSHPHPVSRHAALPATRSRRATPPQGLDPLRHGPRGFPAAPHDTRRVGRGLCLVLPPALLARLDLAAPPPRLPGRAALLGYVVPLQAFQPPLALSHSPPPDGLGLAAPGGVDPPP